MRDAYDQMLVEKSIFEEITVNAAYEYGVLELYLAGTTVDYFVDLPDWAEDFIEDGRVNGRQQFTAEELFIMAHEYDVREFHSFANCYPFPKL